MKRLKFFLKYISRHWMSYSAGIIFILLTNWLTVTIPNHIQASVDLLSLGMEGISTRQQELYDHLWMILLLALTIIVVRSLSRVFFFNPGRAIEFEVKNDLFQQLVTLQKDYFDKNPTGGIVSRIQNDITGMRLLCGFVMMQAFNILSALSFTPYKMWMISPNLTLMCIIPVILVFAVVRVGMRVVILHSKERQTVLQSISSYIVASLSGIDVIKGYHLGKWSAEGFEKLNQSFLYSSLRISFVRSFLIPVLNNLENILRVLILTVGGWSVIKGEMTIGGLTAFMAYGALLTMPLSGLGWISTLVQQAMVGVASIETILKEETPHLSREPLDKPPMELFAQGLQVKNLTYRYPDQDQPILSGISFSIQPGETLGILGQIGSGKTTLANCLNQYLHIAPGQVFLGAEDIVDIPHQELRKTVKTVSQDVFLFSDSLENNIAFGYSSEKMNEETLGRVIYESALTEEVERFPEGVDTLVGEKGIMLSGGQKQRISLARALVEPAPLLILDNVLSAVDYATERFLLDQILQRRTCQSLIIISHRVQALEKAEHILVMDQGRIIDRGSHEELLQREGLYKQTYDLQQGEENE